MLGDRINDPHEKLDREWIELIQIAKDLGIPIEEIRHFLKQGQDVKCLINRQFLIEHRKSE